MNRPLASRMSAAVAAVLCAVVFSMAAFGQDVVTVGSATAQGSTVDVPVSIRDTAGTPLGVDKPAGSRIQAFSIKVSYSPAIAVSSVTFSRAGITASLTPTFESKPATAGSISLLDTFQESTNPIPFTSNAAAPGNQVAHLVFTLSSSAAPGTSIALTLDPALTQLTNEGGSASSKESVAGGTLALVNGSITIPALSMAFASPTTRVDLNGAAQLRINLSSAPATATTIALASSDSSTVSVPASTIVSAGTTFATFNASGSKLGTAT